MTLIDCDDSQPDFASASSLSQHRGGVDVEGGCNNGSSGGCGDDDDDDEENVLRHHDGEGVKVVVDLSGVVVGGGGGERCGCVGVGLGEDNKVADDACDGDDLTGGDLSDDVCLSASVGSSFDVERGTVGGQKQDDDGEGGGLSPPPPQPAEPADEAARAAGAGVDRIVSAEEAAALTRPSGRRSVKFANVQIREYGVTIGDNPTCSYGTPVSLDWEYTPCETVEIDTYEATHKKRRNRRQLLLNYYQRRDLLFRSGYDMDEIKDASRQVDRDRWRRAVTLYLQPVYRIEEVVTFAADAARHINRDPKKRHEAIESRVRSEHQRQLLVSAKLSLESTAANSNNSLSSRHSPTQSEIVADGHPNEEEKEGSLLSEESAQPAPEAKDEEEGGGGKKRRRTVERTLSWRGPDRNRQQSAVRDALDESRHSVIQLVGDRSRHSVVHDVLDESRHTAIQPPASDEGNASAGEDGAAGSGGAGGGDGASTGTGGSSHDDDPYLPSSGSKFERYAVPVDRSEHDKARHVVLCNIQRPHMRAFHFAWISFFVAFFAWFSITPLLGEVQESLDLTKQEVWTSSLCGTVGTIFMRIVIGPACDKWGSRICMALILFASAIPTALTGLVQTSKGLNILRFFIGIAGGSFVACQYWTSSMFVRQAAGLANALVAGWGNLGGGLAQLVMGSALFPLFNLMYSSDDDGGDDSISREKAWRTVFFVPALFSLVTAYIIVFYCDDSPKGFYRLRVRTQEITVVSPCVSLTKTALNRNTWILFVQYACCFGVEVTMTNATALYFRQQFGQSTVSAAAISSVFGIMNLFARGLGGACSDFCYGRFGLRGRIGWQVVALVLEGIAIIAFGFAKTLVGSIFALVFLSCMVQSAEGSTFGIVPYIDRRYTGSVVGWVGAGGNFGGVIFSVFFREYSWEKAFVLMGITSSLSGFLCLLLNTKRITAEINYLHGVLESPKPLKES